MKRILIVGSLNMDIVIRVKDIPKVGETLMGDTPQYIPGGKGANQACAAGRLGGRVAMLGAVGRDAMGRELIENLKSAGVDTSYIKEVEDISTGTAMIYVNDEGNNCIVVVQGANAKCDVEYINKNEELFCNCDIIVLQMEIPYDAIFRAINLAKRHGKFVILNPAPAPNGIPGEVIKQIDYFTPNETELSRISNMDVDNMESLKDAANSMLAKGAKAILVTIGENGALLVKGDACTNIPGVKVTPVDTTAAGDTFNGAFAVALSEGKDETEAIKFANYAAAISVTKKGAQTSIPTRNDVDESLV